MKLTVGLILALFVTAAATNTYSQNARISLKLKDATIVDVFREIERNTEFGFFFKTEEMNLSKRQNVEVTDATIDEILKKVLDDTYSYRILDRNIVVTKGVLTDAQQGQKVTGKVTDSGGLPLPGVSVVIKGSTNGTITGTDGQYTLSNVTAASVLRFSFVGMKTEDVVVGNRSIVNVTLSEETIGLEEVVAIGYGTVKKSDVTGSLVSIKESTIKERPVINAVQALQGKAAGVDIGTNVRPGEVASVSIRGVRSISASSSPLYVVDGIILFGTLNDINPNDIASIEILKDASATAIYGSRGANGVVLITTKTGSKGKLTVSYENAVVFDQIHSTTNWASSGEAIDRYRLSEINGGTYKLGAASIGYPDPTADINKFGNSDVATINAIRAAYQWTDPGNFTSPVLRNSTQDELSKGWPAQVPVYDSSKIPTTNWKNLLTRTGITQNHILALSAGTETSKLYFSFGYLDNNGTQKNQGYTRYTAKLNGDIKPVKWLTLGASFNGSMTQQQYGTINRSGSATGPQDAYGIALGQYPMAKPYDDNGQLILYPGNNKSGPVWNPLIDLDNSTDDRRAYNLQANFYGDVVFTPWLKYRMNFGSGMRYQRNAAWQGSQSTLRRTANPQTSAASYGTTDTFNYMLENLLYFDKTFGNHSVGATLLQSAQKTRNESGSIAASKILYDSSLWYNLAANLNGTADSYGTNFTETQMMSYMMRVNYGYKSKYLVTATGRYDAASVLAKGHKWDFFPSFSLAWRAKQEDFMKPIDWLSDLKLRFGYGVVGNSAVSPYTTSGPLTQYNYVFENTPAIGMNPYNMPNPLMGWEHTSSGNIGIDFGFLKNRISGSIELYKSNTDRILLSRSIPAIIGYPFILDNIGKTMNRGLEITISTVNIDRNDLKWSTDLNWSTNHEEIVSLVNGKQDMVGNGWFIGQPISVFRGYRTAGLWQNTPEDLAEIAKWSANGYNFAPGQYRPVEQGTPNYKLEENDKVILGTPRPKWVAGMTNTVSYKGFELSAFVYARIGQDYFSSLIPGGSTGGNFVGYVRSASPSDFWSPTNPNGKWPQPTTNPKASNADVVRSTYINDGSFVSVRNISLGYSVPSKYIKKFNINRLQIYSQVVNPFLFGGKVVKAGINPDDTNGWTNVNSVGDPTGGTNNNTMVIKSYVVGLRITL